jgi:hypothetical protein
MIPSLPRKKVEALSAAVRPVMTIAQPSSDMHLFQGNKAQIKLLRRALRREADSMLHFEYAITHLALYRYVLEREPEIEYYGETALITPEDQIEFAQRIGLAAIPCRFPYQPALAPDTGEGGLPLFDFPLFTDILDFFDRYARAARNTSVGIAADFRSIVSDSLRIADALAVPGEAAPLQKVASELTDYQTKVLQIICDRFHADIAFALFSDELADARLPFDDFFSECLRRLLHPAQEHGLPAVLYTPGALEPIIPFVQQLGFDGVYIAQAEGNDLETLRQAADGQLSFIGGIPVSLLNDAQGVMARLETDGSNVIAVAGEIDERVSISSFLSLVGALSMARPA